MRREPLVNASESRDFVARRRSTVESVLGWYLSSSRCPCSWPQFVFWAGKEQGPGWQDGIQNDLVSAALRLQFFVCTKPSVPEYWLQDDVHCAECGSRWKHFSEEWRMLAFQERLVLLDRKISMPAEYSGIIGSSIAATVGHEPAEGRAMLSLEGWERFMKGEPYLTEPYSRTYS
jgi:hypothetical protein